MFSIQTTLLICGQMFSLPQRMYKAEVGRVKILNLNFFSHCQLTIRIFFFTFFLTMWTSSDGMSHSPKKRSCRQPSMVMFNFGQLCRKFSFILYYFLVLCVLCHILYSLKENVLGFLTIYKCSILRRFQCQFCFMECPVFSLAFLEIPFLEVFLERMV